MIDVPSHTDTNGRRKRNVQHFQGQSSLNSDRLDLVFNPERQVEYLQDISEQRREARDMYENMDLKNGFEGIFEMLWYSQMPCFDIVNITSKSYNDFGRNLQV